MKGKSFLLLFILFFSLTTFSQNLDSLYQVAKTTKNDSVKIRLYNKIAFGYIFNNKDKALKILKEGQELAKDAEFYIGIAELTNTYGIYMDVTGKSDSAKYYFTKALKLSKLHKIPTIETMCLNNLGMYNWNRGNYREAQDYFFQSLKMNEDKGDRKSTAYAFNNIGLIYQEMYMLEEALKYHQKSYEIRKEFDLKKDQAASLNNIGICLKDLGRYGESLRTYQNGLIVSKLSDNLIEYYKILENIGSLYEEQNEYALAANYYSQSLDRPVKIVDEKGKIITLGKLAGIYNKLDNPKVALKHINKAESILDKFPHYSSYAEDFYINAAETNYRLGNHQKARTYIQKFIEIKNTSFSDENAKAIADLEIKYDTEKKEKQILVQRAELAEKELNIQRKNYQLYLTIGLAILLALIGYLLLNQQKIKNRQLKKDNKLKQAMLKIESQNRLQEQRLRISRDLHDNIGAQLTFIISSLDNLKYGFELPKQLNNKLEGLSEFTSVTIRDLRDTIWAMNKSDINFEELQVRVSNFIDKANLATQEINFNFEVEDSLKDLKFSSVVGMNIYRIIQEAINNSIKYAMASIISVNFKEIKRNLDISISDDGTGFNIDTTELGNGINNMKKRAQDINATFKLKSEKERGTTILLKLDNEHIR